ncbi:hypothetical protein EDD18DRAFT_1133931 [Armillaria luteobubalina]|uniref:Uncharacterized protein n=1 Tax=Armillaria luteobubalina TaxID=153913 RepID=A0AA39QK78_9AGAR|nr:hypothetical protein EDD18DRAFT_1133931 [Armillaria luteobubalina]
MSAVVPKKEISPSCTRTIISPMLTTPDTSIPFPLNSLDEIDLQVSLDSALTKSSSPDLRSLLLSLPPDILPKAIRSLTTWRLQESRLALPTAPVLTRRAEELDCVTHPGRRIKWISNEYYAELDSERESPEADDQDQHDGKDIDTYTHTLPSQHDHLDSSQLRRGCTACHIPRATISNSTPTIKPVPVPTNAISTTTIPTSYKANPIPTPRTRKTISTPTSTKTPKSKARPVTKTKMKTKPKARPAIIDAENIPPPAQPRMRPAARKSRIPAPAPRVFGSHNS